jgi:hypothetical protein
MANKSWADYAEAFTIFAKYGDGEWATNPGHDEIWSGPNPEIVSDEDKKRLEELGWMVEDECFRVFT